MDLTDNSNRSDSQIRKFYAGKNVFLTGCTGFYGSILLEKLLRSCTEIGNIYIMIREKKGLTIQQRLEQFSKKDVFNTLRGINPNFMDKVIPMYGDLYEPDFGISPENRQLLIKNVNIFIHNASVVHFEMKVSRLLRANVLGTLKMLELATECKNLETFVYVSTAFSHHYINHIEEKFYPPPCDLKMIEDMIRADEENAAGFSKEALNEIIGKLINLYAFSKAVTEGVVENFARRRNLPCIVYRPSIMVYAIREPHPAWADTKNGPVLMLTLGTLGLLHAIPMGFDILSDYVPVDMATNALVVAIWDYVTNRESNEPQVYNYASTDWNPFGLGKYRTPFYASIHRYPTAKMVWYPTLLFVPNYYMFLTVHLILHMIPAVFADLYLMSQRKKPKAVNLVYKLTKQIRVLAYFMNTSWIIRTDKIKGIVSRLNVTDSDEFLCDLNKLDWTRWTDTILLWTRMTVKDPMETLPYARKKIVILQVLHYLSLILIPLFILYYFFTKM